MTVVPTNRLLMLLAAVMLPCGFIAAAAPSWTAMVLIVAIGCIALAAADAFLSRARLRGVTLQLPAILRLVKGRPSSLDLQIDRTGSAPKDLRVGIVFPAGLAADEETRTTLEGEGQRFHTTFDARPRERGSYRVTDAMVETGSAAGLWDIREHKALKSEIRVYPNLLADKKTAAPLLLARTSGSHAHRQVGKGREFEKLREYIPGDTFNDIHWRATARHGHPVTKVFQVERTQEVYAVLDCSRLSGRLIDGEPALERYLTAALLLGLAVQQEGDLFGVVAFDNRVQTIIRAAAGRTHFGACRDALFAVKPQRVSPDFRELSHFLRMRLRKRSLLMILTDLDDAAIAEEFESNIRVVRRTHLVTASMLHPRGAARVFTGDPVSTSDEVVDRLAGHLRWQALEQTRRRLATQGVSLSLLRPDNPAADLVGRYRQIKGRQLL
jgi:uncharacterized protein (DUF58 family)